jgi:uncharacterized membrane protein
MGGLAGSSLRFGTPFGPWFAVVLTVAFGVVLLLGARQAFKLQLARRRWTLVGLRCATVAGALLFALQPQWIVQRVQSVPGRLAVLVDASRSMLVRDLAPSRAQRALALVQRFRSESKLPFDLFAFGADAHAIKLADLDATQLVREDETRIKRAIERVSADLGEELGAIVVLSDGAESSPDWSPGELKSLGVRVHTVAVAGDKELVDDALVTVKADPVAFLRQAAQVEVSVRSTRRPATPLVVTLRQAGQLVAEATVELNADGEGKVVLPFTASQLGRAVYTLSLPLEDGDVVPENNERAFLVRVTRDKLRVLLLCGAPTWDTRFLRAFLKADPAIDLITFFILRTSSDLTMASPEELSLIPFPTDELFREHLDSFDLVIFQDFNYGPYQVGGYLPRIRDYVVKGGAFAMIGGSRAFGAGNYEHTPIAEILPVGMATGSGALAEGEFQPVVVEALARHPVVELVPDLAQNLKTWAELAPLLGANKLFGLRDGADALLVHPVEKDAQGQPMPVLAVGTAGQGRVLALGADSSWRWGITTAGRRGDASAYDRFWDRALRWLTRDPLLDPTHVETDRERYGPGARLEARMRLRDQRYLPLADRALELLVLDMEGAVQSKQLVQGDAEGMSKAELQVPVVPGAYRVAVRDPKAEAVLAEQGFVVEAGGDELADPRPRPDLLRAIASATGGEFRREAEAPRLEAFDRTRSRALGTVVRAPFATPWFFALLVAAFGLEWALRRSWGLR